jgi:hypothetical protein
MKFVSRKRSRLEQTLVLLLICGTMGGGIGVPVMLGFLAFPIYAFVCLTVEFKGRTIEVPLEKFGQIGNDRIYASDV